MRILPLVLLSLGIWSASGAGQPPPAPKITEQIVSLTVTPASMPKPALKYTLLPAYKDMVHGDALGGYLKCFAEQCQMYCSKEGEEMFQKFSPEKLADMPAGADNFGGKALRNADDSARKDHIDWLTVTPLKRDGINTLLPEVQKMRSLARGLQIRCRGEIKAKKYAEAVETLQTIFGLARHMDQHPTLIGELVGVAIAMQAFQPLEEMMEQADGPNLFWAIAYLPQPVLEFRLGLEGERHFLEYDLGNLIDRDMIWDEESIEKARQKIELYTSSMFQGAAEKSGLQEARTWYKNKSQDAAWLEGCRKRLLEAGYNPKKVPKFPKEQLLFNDVFRKYEIVRDDYFKYSKLSNPQFEALDVKLPTVKNGDDLPVSLLLNTNSFIGRMKIPQMKLTQRLALLQTVAAIRDYAADHGGELPTSLKDVNLPLPRDPVNEMPFEYSVKEGKAILKGAVSKAVREFGGTTTVYEIRIGK